MHHQSVKIYVGNITISNSCSLGFFDSLEKEPTFHVFFFYNWRIPEKNQKNPWLFQNCFEVPFLANLWIAIANSSGIFEKWTKIKINVFSIICKKTFGKFLQLLGSHWSLIFIGQFIFFLSKINQFFYENILGFFNSLEKPFSKSSQLLGSYCRFFLQSLIFFPKLSNFISQFVFLSKINQFH